MSNAAPFRLSLDRRSDTQMLPMKRAVLLLLTPLLFLLAACGGGSSYNPGAPDGWEADGTKWWIEGVDTSVAFRDLTSLQTMDVGASYAPFGAGQVLSSIRQSLIRAYRNHPEVVDSLFTLRVAPQIENNFEGRDQEELKREAYQTLTKHFQEPRTMSRLGEDVRIVYPDSLRAAGVSGRVRTQVYLNEEGQPVAVSLLDSVHPVLDDIAMKATTEMKWRPAYLLSRGQWDAIPAWARFNINFDTR